MTVPATVRITRRVAGHIEQAAAWWKDNHPLAPGAVHDEIEEALAILRIQPRLGAITTNTRTKGVLRLHLSRIHYLLYYSEVLGRVDVLALRHTSRGVAPTL